MVHEEDILDPFSRKLDCFRLVSRIGSFSSSWWSNSMSYFSIFEMMIVSLFFAERVEERTSSHDYDPELQGARVSCNFTVLRNSDPLHFERFILIC